jgi:hypothetical protein
LLEAWSAWTCSFFGRTFHRHSEFLCIFYHVCQCLVGLGWGGVGLITFLGI